MSVLYTTPQWQESSSSVASNSRVTRSAQDTPHRHCCCRDAMQPLYFRYLATCRKYFMCMTLSLAPKLLLAAVTLQVFATRWLWWPRSSVSFVPKPRHKEYREATDWRAEVKEDKIFSICCDWDIQQQTGYSEHHQNTAHVVLSLNPIIVSLGIITTLQHHSSNQ